MAAMNGFDRHRLITALVLLVMAAFVASQYGPAARWRRPLRIAAIVGFGVAVALALGEIALWLSGYN